MKNIEAKEYVGYWETNDATPGLVVLALSLLENELMICEISVN